MKKVASLWKSAAFIGIWDKIPPPASQVFCATMLAKSKEWFAETIPAVTKGESL